MDPDNYQQAWQAHSSQTRVAIDADSLLNVVQRNQQELRAAISWNDFGAIGIELLLLPGWVYMGVMLASPWTWYLMVPALIWSAGFKLVVRARRKQTPNDPREPLLSSAKESLVLVEHQIWLQRNVFWWSQLPIAIALLVWTAHVSWLKSGDWLDALIDVNAFILVFFLALFYFIYYLNQRVIRTQHEPRRQELLTLLASLRDETTSEVSGEYPLLMSAKRVKCSPRRMFVAGLCFVALMLIVEAGLVLFTSWIAPRHDHPERSPFAAVRWRVSQPEVKVGDEWFKLVSLDEIPAPEIVAFSQRTYGNKCQKRFEEDLVELLTRMGHPPQDTVTLVLQSLTSSETRTLKDVPMTRANRRAIRDTAQGRERSEQQQVRAPPDGRGQVHMGNPGYC
jgi:hypothetical protein